MWQHSKTIIITIAGHTVRIDAPGELEGHNRAGELLQRYYESSPTSLKPMTETLKEKVDRMESEAELHRLGLWVPK